VLCAGVAQRQQLLEHDGDLLAVGRAQRIELQRMAADRQLLVMGGAGDRAIDVGKAAAVRLVPGPDFGRRVFGRIGHLPDPLLGTLGEGARLHRRPQAIHRKKTSAVTSMLSWIRRSAGALGSSKAAWG